MDYFFKKAVESVKKRRRSRDEVATDAMIEKNLHLAARNCILNVAPTHTWSVTSKDLADFHASSGNVFLATKRNQRQRRTRAAK
ncbi:hypothetical protein E4U15_001540 [Claviceps sp. LM218 group G6]|nr:hypothetical protein E4U15_001540 [Claviceps sp. LM218 group G6]